MAKSKLFEVNDNAFENFAKAKDNKEIKVEKEIVNLEHSKKKNGRQGEGGGRPRTRTEDMVRLSYMIPKKLNEELKKFCKGKNTTIQTFLTAKLKKLVNDFDDNFDSIKADLEAEGFIDLEKHLGINLSEKKDVIEFIQSGDKIKTGIHVKAELKNQFDNICREFNLSGSSIIEKIGYNTIFNK